MSTESDAAHLLTTVRAEFGRYQALGRAALERMNEDQLHHDEAGANSAAIVAQHLIGNLRSRWTRLFEEDGEKPWRNRDGEFEDQRRSKDELLRLWDAAWGVVTQTLESLSVDDFQRPVRIRGESLTLTQALSRQMTHTAYHVGQLVFLGKLALGDGWSSLTIPKGRSRDVTHGNYLKK